MQAKHTQFNHTTTEAQLRQSTEQRNQVLWIEDFSTKRLLFVNAIFQKMWGYDANLLFSSPPRFLDALLPEYRAAFKDHLAKQRRGEIATFEYRITRADGLVRKVRDHAFPLLNSSGEIYRTVGIAEDITESKEA